jgi:XisH protein
LIKKPYSPALIPKRRFFIDIKARRNQSEIIIVEVKCFADSELHEFYTAVGQYRFYRSLMRQFGIDRPLYLAIPNSADNGIIKQIGMPLIIEAQIKLNVVDLEQEVIEQWLE